MIARECSIQSVPKCPIAHGLLLVILPFRLFRRGASLFLLPPRRSGPGSNRPLPPIPRRHALTLLAAGPWLAWLPLDLLDRLPGTPLQALPLAFGRRRYRTGFVARALRPRIWSRSACWRRPYADAALGRSGGPTG